MPSHADSSSPVGEPTVGSSFIADAEFLMQHGQPLLLESPSGGRVVVSAEYQGRVMTSAVAPTGASLGYLNRSFVQAGKTGTRFDNYGGEDRFWLGPEGGQYGLYFPPGAPFDLGHWQTPAGFQEGTWEITEQGPRHVTFTRRLTVTNYSRVVFDLGVRRTVRVLDATEARAALGAAGAGLGRVDWVAFVSENRITNLGQRAWTKETGALSIWILSMFNPSPDTFVVVPFDRSGQGPIVNDAYFGKIPPDRLWVNEGEGFLVLRCDAQHRGKIGLGATRAREWAGSHSESARLLTLVNFDQPAGVTDYVNSMWDRQRLPFAGDVINSYNDGPTAPGAPPLGGFYEIETSSPAAFLAPGASLTHTQRTFHFVGERAALDGIARPTLGVGLDRVYATIGIAKGE
ncbi:MAG: hypothetical protein JW751_21485 [Polyangiaceae bacterium]|nr:hypothetical protein [Polyangiaceae bacterium]